MTVHQKLEKLRQCLSASGIDACIISSSDPHGSDIPPSNWRNREWLSGFTGSAGTLVVTAESAGLWTDYRYWIQAEEEIGGSGIILFREGMSDVPNIAEWLVKTLPSASRIAFDGRTITAAQAGEWKKYLAVHDISTDESIDFIQMIRPNRTADLSAAVIELSENEIGESRRKKIARLVEKLEEKKADTWIGTALDCSAWLLNVRAGDVPFIPVVLGYVIVSKGILTWYTHLERLPAELKNTLAGDDIQLAAYEEFPAGVEGLPENARILVDEGLLDADTVSRLPENALILYAPDPVMQMKAVKSSPEIARIRKAMEKDGAAVIRFMMELEKRINSGESLGEIQAAESLNNYRAALPAYLGESFSTISAMAEHGAVCHYEARESTQGLLKRNAGLFLIDSGAQWEEGTTDITRTLSLGQSTDRQKHDYSLVLKAHIALSRIRFPEGTYGYQLDAITRAGLWMNMIDYGHGTGHGLGYRLNVHEGPQVLNQKPIDTSLVPGMLISNEPGIYREGEYGIRIENILLCVSEGRSDFGEFLSFETLTLAPYDRSLIDVQLLTDEEIRWVNSYHATVLERLRPYLNPEENLWLAKAASALEA